MKPIIILPIGEITEGDIKQLRANGLCVVEAKNPSAVKFVDPLLPAPQSRTQIENAAIQLSRRLLRGDLVGHEYKKNIASMYVDILVEGTPLTQGKTEREIEQDIYKSAKADELRRLAREDVKAERAKAKETK